MTSYGLGARIAGWVLALAFFANSWITTRMPRTDKELPLREVLREWHFTVGWILLIAVAVRLWFWLREPAPAPPGAMSRSAHAFGRLLVLMTYGFILLTCLLGIGFAWGSGFPVSFLGVQVLPDLFANNYRLWKFAGYFHSGVSFTMLLINLTALCTATWYVFRYRVGWLQALPEPFVVQAFLAFTMTVWALINTGAGGPGVQIFWGISAVVLAASVWWRGRGPKAVAA